MTVAAYASIDTRTLNESAGLAIRDLLMNLVSHTITQKVGINRDRTVRPPPARALRGAGSAKGAAIATPMMVTMVNRVNFIMMDESC